MTKQDIIRKLASRKFWALLAGFICGTVLIFQGHTDTETITGAIMAGGAVVSYILAESLVDGSNATSTSINVQSTTSAAKTAEKIAGIDG